MYNPLGELVMVSAGRSKVKVVRLSGERLIHPAPAGPLAGTVQTGVIEFSGTDAEARRWLLDFAKRNPPKEPVLPSCPQFTCPNCGSHRLEEVMTDCTASSEVLDVGPGGDLDYGEQSNDGGVLDRYQCLNCGWTVPNAEDAETLAVALGVDSEDSQE